MKTLRRRPSTVFSRSAPTPGGNALPKSVDAVLENTLRSYRLQGKLNTYSCFKLWPEVVGEQFAKVSFPEKITRGRILVIRVIDPAYAQELALEKQEILQRFFEISVDSSVAASHSPTHSPAHFEDIRFVVSGPKSIAEREALK